ncbi:MAG TPA: hypothetical protein VGN64_24480, partial [Dyadobacter sp.]|nr:hypothetical protein [Dyadobacter sp.]
MKNKLRVQKFSIFVPKQTEEFKIVTLIKSISGIRGIVGGKSGEALTPIDVVKFAAAYGTWLKRANPN